MEESYIIREKEDYISPVKIMHILIILTMALKIY